MKLSFTVSGLPGSGKTTVAKILSKRYCLEYFSPGEYFRKLAENKGIGIRAYWEGTSDADNIIVDKEQLAKAMKGNAVLDGRYSGVLCHQNGVEAFKIYLDADLDTRAGRIHKREGRKSAEEVLNEIALRQAREIERGKRMYRADFTCPLFYDMYVDTSEMSPEQIVKLAARSTSVRLGLKQLPGELAV